MTASHLLSLSQAYRLQALPIECLRLLLVFFFQYLLMSPYPRFMLIRSSSFKSRRTCTVISTHEHTSYVRLVGS